VCFVIFWFEVECGESTTKALTLTPFLSIHPSCKIHILIVDVVVSKIPTGRVAAHYPNHHPINRGRFQQQLTDGMIPKTLMQRREKIVYLLRKRQPAYQYLCLHLHLHSREIRACWGILWPAGVCKGDKRWYGTPEQDKPIITQAHSCPISQSRIPKLLPPPGISRFLGQRTQ
jgi:hypothetical protein